MPAFELPVLVAPAHPFSPIEQWQAMLPEHLSGCCEPRIWSWKAPPKKGRSLDALRQLSLQGFRNFLQGLPEGFFVLADGLSGLFFLEALVSFRGEPGGMIWANPRLDFRAAARPGLLCFAPWLWPFFQRRSTFWGKHSEQLADKRARFFGPSFRANKTIRYSLSEKILWLRILQNSPALESLQTNSFPVLLLNGDLSPKEARLAAEGLNRDLPNSELIRFAHLHDSRFWDEAGLISYFVKKFISENNALQRGSRFPLLSRNKSRRITLR